MPSCRQCGALIRFERIGSANVPVEYRERVMVQGEGDTRGLSVSRLRQVRGTLVPREGERDVLARDPAACWVWVPHGQNCGKRVAEGKAPVGGRLFR